jgi:hypothetical protein
MDFMQCNNPVRMNELRPLILKHSRSLLFTGSGGIKQNSGDSNLRSTIFRDEFNPIYKCHYRLHEHVFITTARAKNVHRFTQLTTDSEAKSGLGNNRPTRLGQEHERGRETGLRDLYSPIKASHFYFLATCYLGNSTQHPCMSQNTSLRFIPQGNYISLVVLDKPLQLTNAGNRCTKGT